MVKQVRAARTRRALVVAAAETFAREGYALATLPAISRRAGVSAGALHFHFASKDDLAREVESAAADAVAELAEGCRPAAAGARQLLVEAASGLLLATVTDPVVRAGFKLGGDPSRRSGARMLHWWQTWVRGLVVQAQAEGGLARDVPPDVATAVIVAATVGFEALGAADRDWLAPERLAQLWTFVLPPAAAPPAPALVPAAGRTGRETRGNGENRENRENRRTAGGTAGT
jgi:AcrR family transcriptional regulator